MKRTKSKRKVFDIYVLTLSQGYPHKASWYDGDHDINLLFHARNNIIIMYTLLASNASSWPMIWSFQSYFNTSNIMNYDAHTSTS